MMRAMDAGVALRAVRERAGLSQAALAERTGTSQATISAYERGVKQPSVRTLDRLLAATGARLTVETTRERPAVEQIGARLPVEARRSSPREPSAKQLDWSGRTLLEVLALAEALPAHHDRELRFPRLPAPRSASR
jgi:transcriptional regulator with XRE-family HTH domain